MCIRNCCNPPPVVRPREDRGQLGGVAGRVIREFGSDPRFFLAHEGACGWWRKSAAIRHTDYIRCPFRARVPAWGECPHVKSGSPSHAEAGRHLSRFLVPEPGGVWLRLLWPSSGAGFGPQCIAFRSFPHPSPGAYKRSSAEPLRELL